MYTQKSIFKRVFEQFWFTKFEVLLHVLFQGGFFLYAFYSVIEKTSVEVQQFDTFFESTVTKVFSETIGEVIRRVATADIATIILWGIVGAIVYVLATAIISAAQGAGFTLVSALHYKHPKGFNTAKYLLDVTYEKLVMSLIAFVFIFYSAALINSLIPFVFERVSQYIAAVSIESFWAVLYSIVIVLLLHIWVFLLRLARGQHRHQDADILQNN